MRRFLGMALWLIACGVCIAPAVAFWQSRDSGYNVSVGGGGGFTPSCSQSSTFLAAATGVTLTADKTNYDTLICGLVSDGVWNFDVLYVWAAPDQTTALINLANPGTFNGTTHGSVSACAAAPSFCAYQGYTGDGSTFYIDSGFNPSTATTPNFVQNSATVGVYVLTSRATGNNMWEIGCTVGACAAGPLFAPYNAGTISAEINSANVFGGGGPTNAQGAWNLTRTTSSQQAIFLNSSENSLTNNADTSISPPNINIIFFGFNTGFGLTSDQLASGWIGKGVGTNGIGTGVDSCKVNNRINTYMANLSVPKNVYSNSAC